MFKMKLSLLFFHLSTLRPSAAVCSYPCGGSVVGALGQTFSLLSEDPFSGTFLEQIL